MTYRLVGYVENWAQYRPAGNGQFFPAQLDPALFTHINFAFALFGFITWSVDPTGTRTGSQRYTGDYSIQPVEWDDQQTLYPALQALKSQNPSLKTLLSVGGWSMNSCDDTPNAGNPHPYGPYTCQLFSTMAADPNARAQFIASAISYAAQYGFDGIDIDWEYPGYAGRGGSPDDLANFLALAQEFRAAAPPGFLLTMAAPAIVPTGLPQSYHESPATYFGWLQQCSQSFDWLNVMSYDYHGAFDDPVTPGTGVNAPLTRDSTPNGPFSIMATVQAYLAAGIDPGKIVLGMPTYGRSYTVANPAGLASNSGYGQPFSGPGPAGPATQIPGVLAYYEILSKLASGQLTAAWDDATLTPYAYSAGTGEWVSYEDPTSLGYKASFAAANGLGGAMVFAVDDDDFATGFPLIRQVKSVLDGSTQALPVPLDDMADAQPVGPGTTGGAGPRVLDPQVLEALLAAAWQQMLNTDDDPTNNNKWLTNGPNNDKIGLYGGLSDSEPALTFDETAMTYQPKSIIAATGTVDNGNGLTPTATLSLAYEHSDETTTSNTVSHSIKVGGTVSGMTNFLVAGGGFQLSLEYTLNLGSGTSTTTGIKQTHMESVPINVPTGKIYKGVLTATVRTVTVPFTATILVSGKSETWFANPVNGHYNWRVSAGGIFGWISQYGLASGDSATYGDHGDGQGMVTICGMLTNQTTTDFQVHTNDITDGEPGVPVTMMPGAPTR
jgi:chitinase